MSPADPDPLGALRARLESDALEGKLEALDPQKLEEAMRHPKAAPVIAELLKLDAASATQGELAPDFDLPRLTAPDGERVALSQHRGQRPVGLVFGSYT